MNSTEERKWLNELQRFLYELLTEAFGANIARDLVQPLPMNVWAKAFTHETISPDFNYEELEYIGDAGLKTFFSLYLMERDPTLNKSQLTELHIAYMSKVYQAQLARELGLGKHVRLTGLDRTVLSIDTDVFESFFGALMTIGDANIAFGAGYTLSVRMLEYIFKDREIDLEKGKGAVKTQLQQIFRRFLLPNPTEHHQAGGVESITVSLEHEHMGFLATYGVKIHDPNIGYGEGNTKSAASAQAYANALNTLEQYGITPEWAAAARKEIEFSREDMDPYIDQARARLAQEGYTDMDFFIARKTYQKGRGGVVQLIGLMPDGRKIPLVTKYGQDTDTGFQDTKLDLVRTYASGQ